jgi:heterokaryon incompatibility protein (HET)
VTEVNMWLINTKTMTMHFFVDSPPPYAILSHAWGKEEVTFADFNEQAKREGMRGFQKIQFTCRQAKVDGIAYAWVDTCCIDKTSSAELSEAINSMFVWYQRSQICYVYLADVLCGSTTLGKRKREKEAARAPYLQSRWWTRSWVRLLRLGKMMHV